MKIIVINILIKINHFIRLVKCYDSLFYQVYSIIINNILKIIPKLVL